MTYEQIGYHAGVQTCPACDSFTELAHHQGRADMYRNVVHWKRERVTKAGIYEFLKLCRRALVGEEMKEPRWRRIYRESTYATTKARELGIVIPAAVLRIDRLQVRSMHNPSSSDPMYKWVHKETV